MLPIRTIIQTHSYTLILCIYTSALCILRPHEVAVGIERHIGACRLVVEAVHDGMAVTTQAREVAQVKRYAWIMYVAWREVYDVVDDDGRRHATERQAPLAEVVVSPQRLLSDVRPLAGMVQTVCELTRHTVSSSASTYAARHALARHVSTVL